MDEEQQQLMKTLSANIKKQRKTQKLTQEELAQKANLSPITISKIERSQVWPTSDTLKKLSKALQIPTTSLFSHNNSTHSEKKEYTHLETRINEIYDLLLKKLK